MKKKTIIFIGITLLIITIIFTFFILKKIKREDKIEINLSSNTEIEQIKKDLGMQGNIDIYTINTEYDGRKTIAIKPEIQYNVILAGIINKNKPEFEQINKIIKKAPNGTGIWVSESSREKFLNIIKNITNCNYEINQEGYLKQEEKNDKNEYDKKIEEMIKSNKLYIIDINSIYYMIDDVTGNIIEYPFEEMDYRTPFESFEFENKTIFIITTNSKGKLDYTDILKEIIENTI